MDTTTISVTIPSNWLEGLTLSEDALRQALEVGLAQLRQQQTGSEAADHVIDALLNTGRIRRLSPHFSNNEAADIERQPPPSLPGAPLSEIIVAQRRGEL